MLRPTVRTNLLASLLLTVAACTQTPAQIDLRGQNSYTRSNNTVASNAPVNQPANNNSQPVFAFHSSAPTATVASAHVDSIGVSDLSAPAHNTQVASNTVRPQEITPFQKSHPETLQPAAGPSQQTINHWTNKPRTTENVSTVRPREESFNIRPQGKSAVSVKEQMVSEVKDKPSSEKAVSQLDSIISNDNAPAKKPEVAVTSKVAKADAPGFMWPVSSKKVISEFGPKGKGKVNDGINIASADGEPVWAAADGEVLYVGNELQGYGNMVLIKHNGDKATTYAHLGRTNVEKYDRVKQGDIIGYVGTTGNVKEPQLHFAIRDGRDPIDPMTYLKRNVASLH